MGEFMFRATSAAVLAIIAIYVIAFVGFAFGQSPCDDTELRRMRFLTQLYAQQRTEAEFALAKTEVERQRLMQRVQDLEAAIRKIAPKD